jgi:hypothetical protein
MSEKCRSVASPELTGVALAQLDLHERQMESTLRVGVSLAEQRFAKQSQSPSGWCL